MENFRKKETKNISNALKIRVLKLLVIARAATRKHTMVGK